MAGTFDRIRERFDGNGLVDLIAGRDGPGGLPSVALKRRGREHVGLCPFHAEKSPSFTVVTHKRPAFWKCHGCGLGGNAVQYVIEATGCTASEAAQLLLGDQPAREDPERRKRLAEERRRQAEREARDAERRVDQARAIWRAAEPDAPIVGAYLRSRAIDIATPPTLRGISAEAQAALMPWAARVGHPLIGRFPAMVAPFQNAAGRVSAVHMTFLRPDGGGKAEVEGKAKLILGPFAACAIRLTPPRRVWALGEGIETCLSVAAARPDWSVWCPGSLGNLAGPGRGSGRPHPTRPEVTVPSALPALFKPAILPPAGVDTVVVLGDGDGDRPTAEALTARAVARYRRRGLAAAVWWAADGQDFNDMIRGAA